MDRDVSTDQGSFPIHGIRDVRLKADTEQHDWSELAAIPEVNTLSVDLKSYIITEIYEDMATRKRQIRRFQRPISGLKTLQQETPSDIYKRFTLPETRLINLHFCC